MEQQLSVLCNWRPTQNYFSSTFLWICCCGRRYGAATFSAWTLTIFREDLKEKKNETWICVMLYSLLWVIASASPDSMETLIPFDSLYYHRSFTHRSFVPKRNSKSGPYFPQIWIPLYGIAVIYISVLALVTKYKALNAVAFCFSVLMMTVRKQIKCECDCAN